MPTNFPLFMDYRQPVACQGFWVMLSMKARLLLEHDPTCPEEEGGPFWLYGVNPGGISSFGSNIQMAVDAFLRRFRDVINDAAEASRTFEDFQRDILESFDTNDEYAQLWEEARQAVREGSTKLLGLPRDTSDYHPTIHVTPITEKPSPAMNPSERVTTAAAPDLVAA